MFRLFLAAAFKAIVLSQLGTELQILGAIFLAAGIVKGLVHANWLVFRVRIGPPITVRPRQKNAARPRRAA